MTAIIIPNWHPIFVNFTVALFSIAVGFYWLGRFITYKNFGKEFLIVARWCLWLSAIITLVTVAFGFYAYYTVAHDEASHIVMMAHRNWAITTTVAILGVATWSGFIFKKQKSPNIFFLLVLLVIFGLLSITAWHGAELVFRYGVGVQPQQKAKNSGSLHENTTDHKHSQPYDHAH